MLKPVAVRTAILSGLIVLAAAPFNAAAPAVGTSSAVVSAIARSRFRRARFFGFAFREDSDLISQGLKIRSRLRLPARW